MIQEIKTNWANGYRLDAAALAMWGYLLWWLIPLAATVMSFYITANAYVIGAFVGLLWVLMLSVRFKRIGDAIVDFVNGFFVPIISGIAQAIAFVFGLVVGLVILVVFYMALSLFLFSFLIFTVGLVVWSLGSVTFVGLMQAWVWLSVGLTAFFLLKRLINALD